MFETNSSNLSLADKLLKLKSVQLLGLKMCIIIDQYLRKVGKNLFYKYTQYMPNVSKILSRIFPR